MNVYLKNEHLIRFVIEFVTDLKISIHVRMIFVEISEGVILTAYF